MKKNIGTFVHFFIAILISADLFAGEIIIENESFRYVISSRGKNIQFIDKYTNHDYLLNDKESYCASVFIDNKTYPVDSVYVTGDKLKLIFRGANFVADIVQVKSKNNIIWEVSEVKGDVSSLTFLNIPLKLQGLPNEPFAACALSLNMFTQVKQLPALQSYLWATCYKNIAMNGAKVALVGVPQKEILQVIREIMLKADEMPVSKAGGAWADSSNQSHGSYIMNFGNLTEKTVDEWIAYCASVGFNQIDHHGGEDGFFRFGDFELDDKKWPDGWNHFTRINNRLRKAGISSIFHTYAFFIDKTSKYVTPVPSPDLMWFRKFTLKKPVTDKDTVIEIQESPSEVSLFTGFHYRNSVTLRIGNELIEFTGISTTPPYTFTGCKRGANGTIISAHDAADTVYHIKELFGKFVPGPETKLFDEIAVLTADIVNKYDFDGIYFDAIDGSDILDNVDKSWYYASKFIFTVVKHLQRPVSMEMSLMTHHFWHYRSRWQAWDVSRRGHKRFVDIHLQAINKGLLLPLNLGWWLNFTWDPPQTEHTFSDDVEYLGCKQIAYNAGLSLLGGYEKKEVDENPSFIKLNAIIKQYEELRHQDYFSDRIKKILKEPGKEFTLIKDDNGKWNFKPAVYHKHKVSAIDSSSNNWAVSNSFDKQPLKLRIHALKSVASYDDPSGKIIADFSDPGEFVNMGSAPGVSGEIITVNDTRGKAAFNATNNGISLSRDSWIKMEKKFNPWIDMNKKQGLGLWVKGDGNNQLLNIRIESPYHLSTGAKGDHFVKIDFKGWKYFELVELTSGEAADYQWPDYNPYQSHMFSLQFESVDKIQIWYNGLPKNIPVTSVLGSIKALPLLNGTIEYPSITIKGKKIIFPVVMKSGMYLEFNSMSDCKLYDPKGKLLSEVKPVGNLPILERGKNNISFTYERYKNAPPRTEITVISHGQFLPYK